MRLASWTFIAALASAAIASAQPAGDASRERRMERRDARRDEMFRMVDAYIAMNIEEKLGLTDEQFARVLPLVKRLQSDRRRFASRRTEIVRDLRDRLQSGAATEGQVGQTMKDLKELEQEEPAVVRKDREAIDQTLSVVQQAKLRVLEVEVERKIRQLTLQRPGGPNGPGGSGAQGGPGRRPMPGDGDD
jgi:hypothetical protein